MRWKESKNSTSLVSELKQLVDCTIINYEWDMCFCKYVPNHRAMIRYFWIQKRLRNNQRNDWKKWIWNWRISCDWKHTYGSSCHLWCVLKKCCQYNALQTHWRALKQIWIHKCIGNCLPRWIMNGTLWIFKNKKRRQIIMRVLLSDTSSPFVHNKIKNFNCKKEIFYEVWNKKCKQKVKKICENEILQFL